MIDKLDIASKNLADDYMTRFGSRFNNMLRDAFIVGFKKGVAFSKPILCKDCKWFRSGIDIDGKAFTKCIGANGSVRTYGHTAPDWYCADGERKQEQ